jgi:hypothetical protein
LLQELKSFSDFTFNNLIVKEFIYPTVDYEGTLEFISQVIEIANSMNLPLRENPVKILTIKC